MLHQAEIDSKYSALRSLLSEVESAVVAFSGGVDSSFLLAVASDVMGERVAGVTVITDLLPAGEIERARALAQMVKARHIEITAQPLDDEVVRNNPPDRCYHCKKVIMSKLREVAREFGFFAVLDGSNASDSVEYRPGMRALSEMGILSPLETVGLTKPEIRELSRRLYLPDFDRPAMTCLATRFPYGTLLTPASLSQVRDAERGISELGFRGARLRHHGDIARLEVSQPQIEQAVSKRADIVKVCKVAGFAYVTIDLEGYRWGSMDVNLRACDSIQAGLTRREA